MTTVDDSTVAERREVLHRYARLDRYNNPIVCTPKRGDEKTLNGLRNAGKIYYPTPEAAESARIELEQLGADPMEVIRCHRVGRSGRRHFHLTTRAG